VPEKIKSIGPKSICRSEVKRREEKELLDFKGELKKESKIHFEVVKKR
jgi:hypothetical protein